MSQGPQSLVVKHEGRSIRLTIKDCQIFMAGESAGIVNLTLHCDPDQKSILVESLHLQIPGEETGVESVASGAPGDDVMLTFHSESIALLDEVPESLTLLWRREAIATIVPELAESVPIGEAHRLVAPLEILGQTEMPSENPFCLGVERDFMMLIPAFLLGGFGLAGSFAERGMSASLLPFVNAAGGLLLLISAAIVVWKVCMPRRQVWFDRNRRELLIIESRTLMAKKKLAQATRHGVDGFAHVRVYEREYAPELSSDLDETRTEYFVSLEGKVAFASAEGRAHTRSDALQLARFSGFSGGRSAIRFAAKVGLHAGLEILVASDW